MIYEGRNTNEISFPIGGIGTGSIGLAGNGRLIDWEIQNKPIKVLVTVFQILLSKQKMEIICWMHEY